MNGREVEIRPEGTPWMGRHTAVRRRDVRAGACFAAVFGSLPPGVHRIPRVRHGYGARSRYRGRSRTGHRGRLARGAEGARAHHLRIATTLHREAVGLSERGNSTSGQRRHHRTAGVQSLRALAVSGPGCTGRASFLAFIVHNWVVRRDRGPESSMPAISSDDARERGRAQERRTSRETENAQREDPPGSGD